MEVITDGIWLTNPSPTVKIEYVSIAWPKLRS